MGAELRIRSIELKKEREPLVRTRLPDTACTTRHRFKVLQEILEVSPKVSPEILPKVFLNGPSKIPPEIPPEVMIEILEMLRPKRGQKTAQTAETQV